MAETPRGLTHEQTEPQRRGALEWATLRSRALPFREVALPSAESDGLPVIVIDIRGRPDLERLITDLERDGQDNIAPQVRVVTGAPEVGDHARGPILGVAIELKIAASFEANVLVLFAWPGTTRCSRRLRLNYWAICARAGLQTQRNRPQKRS